MSLNRPRPFNGIKGESATGDAVMRWLDKQGIDQRLVSGFSIFEHVGELPRIMLEMYFDDSPEALADPAPDDVSRETSEPAHDGPSASSREMHIPDDEKGN